MEAPFISLGSEQLSSSLLNEVDVVQRLNDHWTCRIVLRDTPDRRPAVEDYAGKELKISTTELDGTETIIFHGLVRGMRLIYEITGAWGAELEAVSATWKMAQGTRLRYLRQQSAQAAAQVIISGAGLQMGGAMPAGATLSYVQWDETDYSFFARLVDDTEAWFRPAVDGTGGVDVETSFQSGTTVNWREGEYGLLEWTTQGTLQPVTASGANYDPQKMQSTVVGGTSSTVAWYGGAAEQMVAAAQAASGSVESAWVDRHRAATIADLTTRMERESRRGIANTVRCTGISRNPKVRAGDTLQVTGLPGVDATYGVIEVKHVWSTQGYENHFTVTPAQRWSPPARPARPMLDGVYPARVVDNHDPHNQGRIRVQYYWQEDGQSTWVRLLTPHAGSGRGTLFLPELGDEVLVTFEEGDSERPYVVGSAWNGVHQPPATGFHSPGEVNGSEFAQNNIKRIVTKSGHRITLVDTPGKETISIATPTSNRIMLTESHADTGGRPAIVLESAGDIVMAAPNGRIHTQSMHRSAEVGVNGTTSKAAGAAIQNGTQLASAATTVISGGTAKPTVLKHTDGSVESRKGNRAWRDHNPGNIEIPKGAKRSFAAQHGAIGQEDVYAVFPDDITGRNALHDLLKTDTYQNKTIGQAMQMYAPAKDHNDPVAYANALAKHVGVPVDTRVGDLNESQLSGLMDRIGGVEGFTKKGMSTLITPAGGSR